MKAGAEIAQRRGRPRGTFYGDDSGKWHYTEGYPLGLRRAGWDWSASIGLASNNSWRNLSVDGATEQHRGFRQALNEIVALYPDVRDWLVSFDGPWVPAASLVQEDVPENVPWSTMVFYHGTSSHVVDAILHDGLRPRSDTNVAPAYGVDLGALAGRIDGIYLTTQLGMAKFAAISAARGQGNPVVLRIVGIDGSMVAPDEDSKEDTATKSLERIGSIAYLGRIPPRMIRVFRRMEGRTWVQP